MNVNYVALSNLSMYYTRENIEKLYKSNNFKISSPKWKEKSELPDKSCSVSDIQDYLEYMSISSKNIIHLRIISQ